MKVLKQTLPGAAILTLKGEFDTFVTNAFGAEINKLLGDGIHKIVLNMKQVQFINSTALGAMIKARKACRAAQGDLVVSDPSPAVREGMESLGLDRLFAIHASDEQALESLEGRGAVDLEGDSESAVMITTPESSRPQIARLRRLDAETLECRLPAPAARLVEGREVRLKFRLPLYRREYFEVSARIERVEPGTAGTTLVLRFTQVEPEDARAIEGFVADMGELRRAARGG